MSRHRLEPTRPRYGRIVLALVALLVTGTAVLGGVGLVPSDRAGIDAAHADGGTSPALFVPSPSTVVAAATLLSDETSVKATKADLAVPEASGSGRRVVFSQSRQRIWLITGSGKVAATYLGSGSVTDNLKPGSYQVFSRSEHAIGVDDSGTMKWFVRFTRGPSGAAIGFHDIPINHGRRVQSIAKLGTPRSHGCIRQKTSDAKKLWAFAPDGTDVVVVA